MGEGDLENHNFFKGNYEPKTVFPEEYGRFKPKNPPWEGCRYSSALNDNNHM